MPHLYLTQRVLVRLFFIFACLFTAVAISVPAFAAPDDILGKWSVLDRKSGHIVAIANIKKNKKNNTYYARLEKIIYNPGVERITKCVDCPKPFTNQPIKGMVVVWNITPTKSNPMRYADGFAIDPVKGAIYGGEMILSDDKQTVSLRGSPIEAPIFGRTERWTRYSK